MPAPAASNTAPAAAAARRATGHAARALQRLVTVRSLSLAGGAVQTAASVGGPPAQHAAASFCLLLPTGRRTTYATATPERDSPLGYCRHDTLAD